ncbi:TolC family outer membrane protein [Pollutimonas sp. H1-120]|uniref:TolC family outer membrane protein n=1 Tax=Pollutimonas sp. H1-120 TaxID=3148824 RepID=UPI003B52AC83
MTVLRGLLLTAATTGLSQAQRVPDMFTLRGSSLLPEASRASRPAASAAQHMGSAKPDVVDLSQAWRMALDHDYRYKAAISERLAAQTARRQGRAGLLPQVQAGYIRGRVTGAISQFNFSGRDVSSDISYDSSNAYIQLQQALLDYGRYAGYRRGVAMADEGTATFMVRQQETGSRLAAAYFNVLLANDRRALQRARITALAERLEGLKARYARSAGTTTAVRETAARLAVAKADEIAAHDELVVAARELQSMLGFAPVYVAGPGDDFPLRPPQPADLDEWLRRASANNPSAQAAREAVNVAQAELDQAKSEYWPTVSLVASYSNADSENLSVLSQRSNTFMVGIHVAIPIFTGGYTTANVARARETYRQRQHEFDAAREKASADTLRQYTNVVKGVERILALQSAVASSQLSVDAARKAFSYGVGSNLDVLDEQDVLFEARSKLEQARLEYLMAYLQLEHVAGELESSDFDSINDLYLSTRVKLDIYP